MNQKIKIILSVAAFCLMITSSAGAVTEVTGTLSSGTSNSTDSTTDGSIGGNVNGGIGGSIGGNVNGGGGGGSGGGGGGSSGGKVLGASTSGNQSSGDSQGQVLGASTIPGFPTTGLGPKNIDTNILLTILATSCLGLLYALYRSKKNA